MATAQSAAQRLRQNVCTACNAIFLWGRSVAFCPKCRKARINRVQRKAYDSVSRAVERGELPAAKRLRCVSCGKKAGVYDHRDYAKPLNVQPVCKGCNIRLGNSDCTRKWAKLRRAETLKKYGL